MWLEILSPRRLCPLVQRFVYFWIVLIQHMLTYMYHKGDRIIGGQISLWRHRHWLLVSTHFTISKQRAIESSHHAKRTVNHNNSPYKPNWQQIPFETANFANSVVNRGQTWLNLKGEGILLVITPTIIVSDHNNLLGNKQFESCWMTSETIPLK